MKKESRANEKQLEEEPAHLNLVGVTAVLIFCYIFFASASFAIYQEVNGSVDRVNAYEELMSRSEAHRELILIYNNCINKSDQKISHKCIIRMKDYADIEKIDSATFDQVYSDLKSLF